MNYYVDIQHASKNPIPVDDEQITLWVQETLKAHKPAAELTIRLVDAEEIKDLNHRYRKKDKPTNVLAFPSALPAGVELPIPLLGDVIICPSVLLEEATTQSTELTAHWAHIVIHGVLHLLGFDHIEEADATVMQAHETKLLAEFGFKDPYNLEEC